MSHQNTPYMYQLGHEEFVLNCCLVTMVTNHVSNLQDISIQINVSCDCLFELWFISYSKGFLNWEPFEDVKSVLTGGLYLIYSFGKGSLGETVTVELTCELAQTL